MAAALAPVCCCSPQWTADVRPAPAGSQLHGAVALTGGEGATVAFKQNNIGLLADGSLAIGMTADAFAQAIGAAGSAQASTDAAASTGAEAAATTGN